MQQKMNEVIQKRDKIQKIIDLMDQAIQEVNTNKDVIIKPEAIEENLQLIKNTLVVNKGYLDPNFLLN